MTLKAMPAVADMVGLPNKARLIKVLLGWGLCTRPTICYGFSNFEYEATMTGRGESQKRKAQRQMS